MTTTHHQPGQDVFRSIREQDIDFQPFPSFPPPAQLAVVVGHPASPVRTPSGSRRPPG